MNVRISSNINSVPLCLCVRLESNHFPLAAEISAEDSVDVLYPFAEDAVDG